LSLPHGAELAVSLICVCRYEVKFQNVQECGGAYLKLLTADNNLDLVSPINLGLSFFLNNLSIYKIFWSIFVVFLCIYVQSYLTDITSFVYFSW